jgi:hypothetical protein
VQEQSATGSCSKCFGTVLVTLLATHSGCKLQTGCREESDGKINPKLKEQKMRGFTTTARPMSGRGEGGSVLAPAEPATKVLLCHCTMHVLQAGRNRDPAVWLLVALLLVNRRCTAWQRQWLTWTWAQVTRRADEA